VARAQRDKKIYCKECQFYIPFSQEIIQIGKESEDGRDICGYSISSEKNHIGNESIITQGDLVYCEECGSVLKDDRQPIYRKCKAVNRKKNCKNFLQITKLQLLKNDIKRIIIKLKNMLNSFNITKNYLLLFWLLFNIIFLSHYNIYKIIDTKTLIYYSLIMIFAIGMSMKK